MLGKILGGLAALIVILGALGFILPDKAHVEREIVINAPQEEVFALISDFNAWNAWSPWAELDPNAQYTITGAASGLGHRMEWTSDNPEVGAGSQEITAVDAPNSLSAHLDFGDMGKAEGSFALSPVGGGVKVVWSLDANMREGAPIYMQPVYTYMGFFMDAMGGKDFEKGLAALKRVAEAE